jgi:hypothetical protein
MNTKSFILSGIVGTIIYYLLGGLFYGLLFTDIYPQDTEKAMSFIFLGCLFYAFTFALIFNRWAQISSFVTGVKAGFLLGLLFSLSMNFFMYASMSVGSNFLIQIAIETISAAILGGVIALVIGKAKS